MALLNQYTYNHVVRKVGLAIYLRNKVNSLIGSLQTRKKNKQRYNERTLVLANNWDGSVQQFYHFLLGYFMPLCLWLDKTGANKIAVRDCGPMNPWFELLQDHVDIEIMPPGSALHVVIGDLMSHVVLEGMDDPRKFSSKAIQAGSFSVLKRLKISASSMGSNKRILIVDRSTSENFYHEHGSETHMSGKERRHVPNLIELKAALPGSHDVQVVDFARMNPLDQIREVQQATTLVGQHGAGLVHMLWMPPNSHVVEIAPPLPSQVEHIFQELARTLGHSYERIEQEGVHAPVSISAVVNAIETRC